jgi:two-component sensor histidine kinase
VQPKSHCNFLIRRELPLLAVMLQFFVFSPVAGLAAGETATNTAGSLLSDATNHLGQWIWDTNTLDKQTCRFWRSFEISRGAKVSSAIARITVDNGFTFFLDGQEIGRGSDWRTVTEYDVTWLLNPGKHVLAVEGFNDRLEAGMIFGLHIELVDQRIIEIVSDNSWRVVPVTQRNWVSIKNALPDWHPAIVVGAIHHHPWEIWPFGLTIEPPLHPVVVHFWQTGWFQLSLLSVCALALLFCGWLMTQLAVQSKTQRFLQVERARIARDIHDDLGAQLTQLLLLGEVAQREQPEGAAARAQFNQICARARELSHAMDEVVWVVNSRRDTLRDFVNYVCKYARIYLDPTPIRCRLDVEPEIPPDAFDLPVRRNLFLAVKEALNNAAKHSGAGELFLRICRKNQKLVVAVEDNGKGFDPAQAGAERNGLINMSQRMSEVGGDCNVVSQPGGGCRVVFTVPLARPARAGWFSRRRSPDKMEDLNSGVNVSGPPAWPKPPVNEQTTTLRRDESPANSTNE